MSGFSIETGHGDIDWLSRLGSMSTSSIRTDVSLGAPPEQPRDPTGNGTGQFMTSDWQGALFGGLQTALNYAIYRDQQKMTAVAQAPVQQAQVEQVKHSNTMSYVLIGAAVLAVVMVTRK